MHGAISEEVNLKKNNNNWSRNPRDLGQQGWEGGQEYRIDVFGEHLQNIEAKVHIKVIHHKIKSCP